MAKKFTESRVWQEGHKLVLVTYRFLRAFPANESSTLKSEIQKSAIAITSNLADACSFDNTSKRLEYLMQAQTAMIELQNCLLIARDVNYLKPAYYDEIARQVAVVQAQIVSQIKTAQRGL